MLLHEKKSTIEHKHTEETLEHSVMSEDYPTARVPLSLSLSLSFCMNELVKNQFFALSP